MNALNLALKPALPGHGDIEDLVGNLVAQETQGFFSGPKFANLLSFLMNGGNWLFRYLVGNTYKVYYLKKLPHNAQQVWLS